MLELLLTAAALSALAAIYSDRGGVRRKPFYFLKPLTTLLIIGVALLPAVPDGERYQQWIVIGLVLSLAGDIALMFHGNRWFIAGLLSFLVAHLAFVAAFVSDLPQVSPPWWSLASPLIGVACLPLIWPGAGKLRPAIVLYGLVLCAMVVTAAARHAVLPGTPALLAVVGAALFQVSDSTLAYKRFTRPFPGAQAVVLSTYWLAIALMALSA